MGQENCSDAKIMVVHVQRSMHTHVCTRSDDVQSYNTECSPDFCTQTIKLLCSKVNWIVNDRFVFSTKDSTLKRRKYTWLTITTIMSQCMEDASTKTLCKDSKFRERLEDMHIKPNVK